MRRKLAKAVVVLAGIAAFTGTTAVSAGAVEAKEARTVTAAEKAKKNPVPKFETAEGCIRWGKTLMLATGASGFTCKEVDEGGQWIVTELY
ncbi:hypothetical protein [Streptomyces sp. 3N207]|uniref:hypothetical protein n=1 Tax=Streptomyces sp. 3N207 TaxID=3457417 RepID=UPI003FD45792